MNSKISVVFKDPQADGALVVAPVVELQVELKENNRRIENGCKKTKLGGLNIFSFCKPRQDMTPSRQGPNLVFPIPNKRLMEIRKLRTIVTPPQLSRN
jgi:hypothetical protein